MQRSTIANCCISIMQLLLIPVTSCSSGSLIDCGAPPNLASGVSGEYNATTMSSVIVYQCQQPGFAPSPPSSLCEEDGRWSPNPSQVVCVMLPGLLLRFPATTVEPKQYCKTVRLVLIYSSFRHTDYSDVFRSNKCRFMLSLLLFPSQCH